MEQRKITLTEALRKYYVKPAKKDVHGSFWAKASQTTDATKSKKVWGWSLGAVALSVAVIIGTVIIPQQTVLVTEQMAIAEHLEDLEDFDVIAEIDILEEMELEQVS